MVLIFALSKEPVGSATLNIISLHNTCAVCYTLGAFQTHSHSSALTSWVLKAPATIPPFKMAEPAQELL